MNSQFQILQPRNLRTNFRRTIIFSFVFIFALASLFSRSFAATHIVRAQGEETSTPAPSDSGGNPAVAPTSEAPVEATSDAAAGPTVEAPTTNPNEIATPVAAANGVSRLTIFKPNKGLEREYGALAPVIECMGADMSACGNSLVESAKSDGNFIVKDL